MDSGSVVPDQSQENDDRDWHPGSQSNGPRPKLMGPPSCFRAGLKPCMAEKVPTPSARQNEAPDHDSYRQHQTVGCTRTGGWRKTDLVEAAADSDFRRDQVS